MRAQYVRSLPPRQGFPAPTLTSLVLPTGTGVGGGASPRGAGVCRGATSRCGWVASLPQALGSRTFRKATRP